MNIENYTLKVKGKTLLKETDLAFSTGVISHIVGKNGVGKSQFAKDLLLNTSKQMLPDVQENVCLISSASNIPHDVSKDFLLRFLRDTFNEQMISRMEQLLNLSNIDGKILIKHLSDGQKQKLKLLSFLLEDKAIIVLDEITNSLDKKTIMEIHQFLNEYIEEHPEKIIINITHELSDLKAIAGDYYLLHEQRIVPFASAEQLIDVYIHEA
ncbi:ABC transporter ATP-binding protein [Fictibacillus macauensis ZFHKF-1]|uniref:ABC transporter ATP-binding protein n=1 Tax=Fictibacillus macauensis ZFHKF-1 TaxID=1196324 RepID=I8AJR1_9BACL|nr:ATP-binding cassette domain-containing protein [Fictibacillus macauensis]EIT86017.1 ABC transporter ATP-binding protein [Fictibacillus macauensis ZFHKF-1]